MTADLLREAAAKMRERAGAATPGPWEVLWHAVAYIATVNDPSDPTGRTPMQEPVKVADAGDDEREHIASWHPAVALAVADWLSECARLWEYGDVGPLMWKQAVAVARTYLGRDA